MLLFVELELLHSDIERAGVDTEKGPPGHSAVFEHQLHRQVDAGEGELHESALQEVWQRLVFGHADLILTYRLETLCD